MLLKSQTWIILSFALHGFSSYNEVDYEITEKGEPEKGSVISRKSIVVFIAKIIENPEKYRKQNLSMKKPNS